MVGLPSDIAARPTLSEAGMANKRSMTGAQG
jgi:hypothetical protein